MIRGSLARAVGLCLTGTGVLLFASAANAAPAPDGSYQQSCRDFAASRGTLTAECKNRNGEWNNTELADYRGCSGDISNNDGQLTCQQGSGGQGYGDDHGTGDRNRGDNGNDGDRGGPQGSYKDTCRNVRFEGGNLVAECRTRDGEWHRTSLDKYRECRGDISNDDGRLRCQRADEGRDGRWDEGRGGRGDEGRGGGGYEPRGSYQQTCRRIRAAHGDLEADCRTRGGDWRHSSLDNFRDCRGDIANDNGRLVCSNGGGGNRFAQITLYKDSRYRGPSRTYNSDTPDLGGFSDRASSANVQGGVWQLCTRRFYRGRCVTLDNSNGNFVSLDMNDRVESLRRVR